MSKDAFTCQGKVDGKKVSRIKLDTGCSRTVVSGTLVDSGSKKLKKESVEMYNASGKVLSYRLADVEVELDGEKYSLEVAIAETLPVDVLLGTDVPLIQHLTRRAPNAELEAVQKVI